MMHIIGLLSLVNFIYSSIGTPDRLFASDFRAPEAPLVIAEYHASYVQHKWDASGISNIVSGVIYANLGLQSLRMDVTYDGIIASSFFDYSNSNIDGTVPNYIYTLTPTIAGIPSCASYNVTPAYPLFQPNILIASQATFTGLVKDNLFYADQEALQAWDLLFGGAVSVTVYLNSNNTLVRMDFSSPIGSTFTTTRLFNITPGPPAANLFVNPCPSDTLTPRSQLKLIKKTMNV